MLVTRAMIAMAFSALIVPVFASTSSGFLGSSTSTTPPLVSPALCADTCACWGQFATDGAGTHTCGARIVWVQGHVNGKSDWAAAAMQVYKEFPSVCKCEAPTTTTTTAAVWQQFGGHEYILIDTIATWDAQKSTCESLGAHMVAIDSAAENDFIVSMMPSSGDRKEWLWIGMTRGSLDSWIDGTPMTYTKWAPGQPSNQVLNGGQDCGEIYRPTGDNWHDNSCNNPNGQSGSRTVCEKDGTTADTSTTDTSTSDTSTSTSTTVSLTTTDTSTSDTSTSTSSTVSLTTTEPQPTPAPATPAGPCVTIPHPDDIDLLHPPPPCVFPFKHTGVTWNGCLRYWGGYWCPTKVNAEGEMEAWGDCAASCPRANQPLPQKRKP